MRKRPLLGCLVLSGYAGVAYELLWVRQLALVFGSTTGSFSTVLGVFFGGLALGSYLASRWLARVSRPALAYGVVEFATAASATVLTLVLPHLSEVVSSLELDSVSKVIAARLIITSTILLPVSTLMGMTLPLACRALLTTDQETGRGTAVIYGINTLGAFLGAYVTTYHLLAWLGVQTTSFVTVGLNLLAAVVATADDVRAPVRVATPPPPPSRRDAASSPPLLAVPFVLTFLSGFSFIALEVVWSRIASIMLGGSVYGLGAVLIVVLLGIALGSGVAALIFRTRIDLRLAFAGTQTLQLGLLLATFAALPIIGYELAALSENRGGLDPVHTQLLGMVFVLLLPCVMAGASLPLLVRMTTGKADEAGGALGRLYAFNTVGSILGSVLTGLLILPRFGSDSALFIGLFTVAASVLTAAIGAARPRLVLALAAACMVGALTFDGVGLERLTLMRQVAGRSFATVKTLADADMAHSIYYSEGESASVRVSSTSHGFGMTLNGLGQGGRNFLPPYSVFESLLVATVPLLHVSQPRNALVVGLGAGITVSSLADLGVPRIKVVELEPKVLDAVERIFEGAVSPLHRQGIEVEIGDARYALLLNGKEGAGKERFDVIASMPAHPWVASPIFTREFFALAKRNLSPTGVFSTWFGRGQMDATALRSLFQSFADVFDHYFVYYVPEVGAFYLVGSPVRLQLDEARLAELLARPELKSHLLLRDPTFFPARVFASADDTTAKPSYPVRNTDDSALIELRAPLRSSSPLDGSELTAQFPEPFLAPRLLKAANPGEYLARALEARLESVPFAEPGDKATLDLAQVQSWLTAMSKSALLAPNDARYFAGRIAALDGDTPKVREELSQVEATSPHYVRAQIALARLESFRRPAQLKRILDLPYSPEAAFALAELDPGLVHAFTPTTPGDGSDDDWLVRAYAAGAGLASDGKTRLEKGILADLRDHVRPLGKIVLARGVAERAGMEEIARVLEELELGRRAGLEGQYLDRGNKLYRKKRYGDAALALETAATFNPANVDSLKKLYHCYRKTQDQDGMTRVRAALAVKGLDEEWVQALDRFLDKTDEVAEDPSAKAEPTSPSMAD